MENTVRLLSTLGLMGAMRSLSSAYEAATGAREAAVPRLQSAAQMCRRINIEYVAAKLELNRLQH